MEHREELVETQVEHIERSHINQPSTSSRDLSRRITGSEYSADVSISLPHSTTIQCTSTTLSDSRLPGLHISEASEPPYRDLLRRLQSSVRREEAMLRAIADESGVLEPSLAEELVQELSEQLEQSERESRGARETLEQTKKYYSNQLRLYEKQIAEISENAAAGSLGSHSHLELKIAELERDNCRLRAEIQHKDVHHQSLIGDLKIKLQKELSESRAITSEYRKQENETSQKFLEMQQNLAHFNNMKTNLQQKIQSQQEIINSLRIEKTRADSLTNELKEELERKRKECFDIQENASTKYSQLSSWQTSQYEQMKEERINLMKDFEKERLRNAELEAKVRSMEINLKQEINLKENEQKTVSELQVKLQELTTSQVQLQKQLGNSDLERQMFSQQRKQEVKTMQNKLNDLAEANEKLQFQNHELGLKVNSLKAEKIRLLQELEQNRALSVAEVSRLESSVPAMLSKIKQENLKLGEKIRKQLNSLREDKKGLQHKLGETQHRLGETSKSLDMKSIELIEMSKQSSCYVDKIGELENAVAISETESQLAHSLIRKEVRRRRGLSGGVQLQVDSLRVLQVDHKRLVTSTHGQLMEFASHLEMVLAKVHCATVTHEKAHEAALKSLQQKLSQMQREVELRDVRIMSLSREKNESHEIIEQLRKGMDDLKIKFLATEKRQASLSEESEQEKSMLLRLQNSLDTMKEEKLHQESKLNACQREKDHLEEEFHKLSEGAKKQRQIIQTLQRNLTDLRNKNQSEHGKLETCSKKNKGLQHEYKKLHEQAKCDKATISKLMKAMACIREQKQCQTLELEARKREVSRLQIEVQNLSKAFTGIRGEDALALTGLATKLSQQAVELECWKSKCAETQKAHDATCQALAKAQEQLKEADRIIEEKHELIATFWQDQNSIEGKLLLAKRENRNLKNAKVEAYDIECSKRALEKSLLDLTSELNNVKEKLRQEQECRSNVEDALKQEHARIRELREFSDALRKEKAQARGEANALRKRVKEVAACHDVGVEQLHEENFNLMVDIEVLKNQVSQLKEQKENHRNVAETCQKRAVGLAEKKAELEVKHARKVEKLNEEIKALKAKLNASSSENSSLVTKILKLNEANLEDRNQTINLINEISDISDELSSSRKSKETFVRGGVSLVNEIDDLKQEIFVLKDSKQVLIHGSIALVNTLSEVDEQVKSLRHCKTDVMDCAVSLINGFADIMEEVDDLKARNYGLVENSVDLINAIADLTDRKSIEPLTDKISDLEDIVEDLQLRNRMLTSNGMDLINEISDLDKHRIAKESLIDCGIQLVNYIADLDEENKNLMLANKELRASNREAESENEELMARRISLASKYEFTSHANIDLELSREELITNGVDLINTISDMAEEIKKLNSEKVEFVNGSANLVNEVSRLDNELFKKIEDFNLALKNLDEFKDRIQTLEKELQNEVARKLESISQLENEETHIESLVQSYNAVIQGLENDKKSLTSDLNLARIKMKSLQESTTSNLTQKELLERDCQMQKESLEKLSEKYQALAQENDTLHGLEIKVNDLQKKNQQLNVEKQAICDELTMLRENDEERATIVEANRNLREEIEHLNEEVKEFSAHEVQLQNLLETLQNESDADRKRAMMLQEKVRVLSQEAKSASDLIEELQENVQKHERNSAEYKLLTEQEKTNVELSTAAMTSKQLQIDRLRTDLEEEREMKKLVKKQLNELQSRVESFQEHFSSLEEQRESSERNAETLRRQLSESEKKEQNLHHELEKIKSELAKQKSDYESINAEQIGLIQDKEHLSAAVEELTASKRLLQEANHELESRAAELQQSLENNAVEPLREENRRLEESLEGMNRKCSELQKTKHRLSNLIIELEERQKESNAEITQYQTVNASLMKQSDELEAKYEEYEKRIESMKSENKTYLEEIKGKAKMKIDMEEIKTINEELRRKIEDLEHRDSESHEELEVAFEELKKRYRCLEETISSKDSELSGYKSYIDELTRQNEALVASEKKAKFSASIVETEVECCRLEITRLDGVVEDLRESKKALEMRSTDSKLDSVVLELQSSVAQLHEENSRLYEEQKEWQIKVQKLQNAIEEKDGEQKLLNKQFDDLRHNSVDVHSFEEIQGQLEKAETELSSVKERNNILESQNAEISHENGTFMVSFAELQKEMKQKDKIASDVEQEMYTEYTNIKKELAQSLEQLLQAEEKNGIQQDKIQKMTDIISEQQVEIANCQSRLLELQNKSEQNETTEEVNEMLTQKNIELENQINEVLVENESLREKMEYVKDNPEYYQYAELKQERDEAREKLDKIKKVNHKLSPKVYETKRALDHEKRVTRTLRSKLKDVQDELKAREKSLRMMQETVRVQTTDLEAKNASLEDLTLIHEDLQESSSDRISTLEKLVRELKDEKRQLSRSMRMNQTSPTRTSSSSPRSPRATLTTNPSSPRIRVKHLENENARLKKSEMNLKRQLSNRSAKKQSGPALEMAKKAEAEILRLKEELNEVVDLKCELEKTQQENATLLNSRTELESKLEELESICGDGAKKRMRDLKVINGNLKREKVQLIKSCKEHEKRILELETFLRRNDHNPRGSKGSGREMILKKENERLQKRIEAISHFEAENKELQGTIKNLEENNQAEDVDLEKIKQQWDAEKREMQMKIEKAKNEIKNQAEDVDLEKMKQQWAAEKREMQMKIERAKMEIAHLKRG